MLFNEINCLLLMIEKSYYYMCSRINYFFLACVWLINCGIGNCCLEKKQSNIYLYPSIVEPIRGIHNASLYIHRTLRQSVNICENFGNSFHIERMYNTIQSTFDFPTNLNQTNKFVQRNEINGDNFINYNWLYSLLIYIMIASAFEILWLISQNLKNISIHLYHKWLMWNMCIYQFLFGHIEYIKHIRSRRQSLEQINKDQQHFTSNIIMTDEHTTSYIFAILRWRSKQSTSDQLLSLYLRPNFKYRDTKFVTVDFPCFDRCTVVDVLLLILFTHIYNQKKKEQQEQKVQSQQINIIWSPFINAYRDEKSKNWHDDMEFQRLHFSAQSQKTNLKRIQKCSHVLPYKCFFANITDQFCHCCRCNCLCYCFYKTCSSYLCRCMLYCKLCYYYCYGYCCCGRQSLLQIPKCTSEISSICCCNYYNSTILKSVIHFSFCLYCCFYSIESKYLNLKCRGVNRFRLTNSMLCYSNQNNCIFLITDRKYYRAFITILHRLISQFNCQNQSSTCHYHKNVLPNILFVIQNSICLNKLGIKLFTGLLLEKERHLQHSIRQWRRRKKNKNAIKEQHKYFGQLRYMTVFCNRFKNNHNDQCQQNNNEVNITSSFSCTSITTSISTSSRAVYSYTETLTMRTMRHSRGPKRNIIWLLIGLVWFEDFNLLQCNIIIKQYEFEQPNYHIANKTTGSFTEETVKVLNVISDTKISKLNAFNIKASNRFIKFKRNIHDQMLLKNNMSERNDQTASFACNQHKMPSNLSNHNFNKKDRSQDYLSIQESSDINLVLLKRSFADNIQIVSNDEIRLESIKQQILFKLGLTRKPNVSRPLPKQYIWDTIYRADGMINFNDLNSNNLHTMTPKRMDNHILEVLTEYDLDIKKLAWDQKLSYRKYKENNIPNYINKTITKNKRQNRNLERMFNYKRPMLHHRQNKIINKRSPNIQSEKSMDTHNKFIKQKTFTYLTDISSNEDSLNIDYKYSNDDHKIINLNNQENRNHPNQYQNNDSDDNNDDYFSNTQEIITFAEKGKIFKQHRLVEFSVQHSNELKRRLFIHSAEIHISIGKGKLFDKMMNHFVSGNKQKRLKIWIFQLIDENQTNMKNLDPFVRFCALLEVNTTILGWQKIDVTTIVKEWYKYKTTEKLRFLIDCSGCGKLYNLELFDTFFTSRSSKRQKILSNETKQHNLRKINMEYSHKLNEFNVNAYELDLSINEMYPNRPFLVLRTESRRQRRVRRRAINCNGAFNGQCCKESFYVSFKALGWDDWIIAPRGYFANYCRGDCSNTYRTPDSFQTIHSHFIDEYRKMGLLNGMQPCCAPTKFSSMSLIYYGDEGIIKRDLPKMVVDECGCP